jgi:sugar phosphate permease
MRNIHYGWVMVVICIGILAARSFPLQSFGVFLKPITAEFGWDRGALSAAISLNLIVGGGLGILSGRLSDRYGPRLLVTIGGLLTGVAFLLLSQINALWHVYLIWGILMGIGFGFSVIPIMSTLPKWFTKKRGIAVGIAMSGMGLGGIIAPLITQWFISNYDWRFTYIILGLITIIIIVPLAQFMRHSPQQAGLEPYGGDEASEDMQSHNLTVEIFSLSRAIKTIRFWLFGLILASIFLCLSSITVHIVPHAHDMGISTITAASILSVTGGIGIIGRLGIGFISDRIGGLSSLIACVGLVTFAIIWLIFAQEMWMFYIFAVVFGIAQGGFITLLSVVTAELFGLVSLGAILGGIVVFATVGDAIGAPLAGGIFDISGNYSLAFIIFGAICGMALILCVILLRIRVKQI